MANQPTSFRFPFNIEGKADPQVIAAVRYAFSGLKDVNDAIRVITPKLKDTQAQVTTLTAAVSAVAAPTPAPSTPAFGNVNLQPNLTPGAYTTAQSDFGGLILVQSAIPFAYTLDSGLMPPFFTTVYNFGSANLTATPTAGNVNNVGSVTVVPSQFAIFFFDGADWWAVMSAIPTLPTFADAEVPAGVVDGANAAFTLANTPTPGASLELFENGLLQREGGADYSLAGNAITFVTPPAFGSTLLAWYRF